MPWISKKKLAAPRASAAKRSGGVVVSWRPVSKARKYAVQTRDQRGWRLLKVVPARTNQLTISGAAPHAIAIRAIDAYGTSSDPMVLSQ